MALPRAKKLPYFEASRRPHVVIQESTVISWLMDEMKQSREIGAMPGGCRHTWIRSPISRPSTCGNKVPGAASAWTVSESNRASSPLLTDRTYCAQFAASASDCRSRSPRA